MGGAAPEALRVSLEDGGDPNRMDVAGWSESPVYMMVKAAEGVTGLGMVRMLLEYLEGGCEHDAVSVFGAVRGG